MSGIVRWQGLVACAMAGLVLPAMAAERIPLMEFAQTPAYKVHDLSPGGTRVLVEKAEGGKRTLGVSDLGTRTHKSLLDSTANGLALNWCEFKTDTRVLCGYRGVEYYQGRPFTVTRLVAVDVDGGNVLVLAQRHRQVAQYQDEILHWLPDDPQHVLIERDGEEDEDFFPDVFKLNVDNSQMQIVVRQRAPISNWFADRAGNVRFGSGQNQKQRTFVVRPTTTEEWRRYARFDRFGEGPFSPIGFGLLPDFLMVSHPKQDRNAIYEVDLRDEQGGLQLLFAHPRYDVGGPVSWRQDGSNVGFKYEAERPAIHYLDPEAKLIQEKLDSLFPGATNRVMRQSKDRSRYLVSSVSDVSPVQYQLLDLQARKLQTLGQSLPALSQRKLAAMTPVEIDLKGHDAKLPGYLTLPVGVEPKGLPTILLAHGGSRSRDTWGFDPLVQLLASRGYAVVQVNYRGSSGYGDSWYDAGRQGWGSVMHQDITAAAKWAIQEGIADARRLCVVGRSYGGYAALIGVAKEPGLYRCAASIAGVSSLTGNQYDSERFYVGRHYAEHATWTEELAANSPAALVANIRVPVLLVHGSDDVRVRVAHSELMQEALVRAGKESELVIIEKGDHTLSREEWRLKLYEKLVVFLGTNL